MDNAPQHIIEFFHLAFLRALSGKLSKNLYALKGGCNLRFFLKSIRYSEDLDIDVKIVATETLRKKVRTVLESSSVNQILKLKGVSINSISEPKQSETVQRWKIGLSFENREVPIPTKIEFSRRGMTNEIEFGPIDSEIIRRHQLYPILLSHYSKEAQFYQKILALIHRSETQARDIFDLHLLIDQGLDFSKLKTIKQTDLQKALENLNSVTFSDFKGQVLVFLEPEYQNYFSSKSVWEEFVKKVSTTLEKLK